MKAEFLVDIVARDTPVAAAVCGGGGDGPDCLIAPTFYADAEKRWTLVRSLYYEADVLVTPSYNAARTMEIQARARLAGARLVHFPSEQIFSRAFDHEKLNTACAAAYRRQVDAVLVWGEYYARRLVEDVGYPRDRIYEVGSPRLELARIQCSGHDQCSTGPIRVLFVSDFTIADLQHRGQRRAFQRTYGAHITEEATSRLAAERRYMLETARALAAMDGFEVRVRPHPGERTEPYREACDGTHVQYADPSVPFSEDLLWSHVVVGYTSTSIFEVAAAGRPFFALRREGPPEIVRREALESLYRVCTAEELIAVLREPHAVDTTQRRLARKAAYCVGNIEGAYDSVAALRAALRQVSQRSRIASATWSDRGAVAWGAVRAACKYAAFRLFASDLWRTAGFWQPSVVRRRLSPAHSLGDRVVERYQCETQDAAAIARSEGRITWELGRWCWRPVADATAGEAAELEEDAGLIAR